MTNTEAGLIDDILAIPADAAHAALSVALLKLVRARKVEVTR